MRIGPVVVVTLAFAAGAFAQSPEPARAPSSAPPTSEGAVYRWVDSKGVVHYSDQPPTGNTGEIVERRIGRSSVVEIGPPYGVSKARQDYPVTLYTDTNCAQSCADARNILARRGVPFTEIVLKTEEDLAAFRKQFGSQEVAVPSLMVGSQKQIGLEEGLWNRMLDDATYPRAGGGSTPAAAR